MSDVLVPPPVLDATQNADNLEAAFAAAGPLGGVVLDDGEYVFNRPLVLGAQAGDSRQWAVSLVGHGPMRSKFKYVGPSDQPALLVSHEKFTRLEGFSLSGPGKGVGTGPEIGRAGGPYNGTMSNGLILKHVSVSNFADGWRLGRGSTACSELTFESCEASKCTRGFYAESYNTLNLFFWGLRLDSNDTGLATSQAGQIAVYGGSGSNNGLTFLLQTGGQHSIRDFRDESKYFGHFAGTTSWTSVVLDNCRVRGRRYDANGRLLPSITTGWGAELLVLGGQYGPIEAGMESAEFGGITLLHTAIEDSQPFRVARSNAWEFPYRVLGCKQTDSNGNRQKVFPDEFGTVRQGQRSAAWLGRVCQPDRVSLGGIGLSEAEGRAVVTYRDGSEIHWGPF